MSFKFVDDIATADCAVEIRAESLEEVFAEAGMSMMARMTDLETVKFTTEWDITVEEDSIDRLFYGWLSELVFIKDSENVLFSRIDIRLLEIGQPCKLRAIISGERIDHARHEISVDIKAVTMHMLRIEKDDSGWNAFVIFDL